MVSRHKIFWSDEALRNLEEILNYLRTHWTEKEIVDFNKNLLKQLELIASFPLMAPVTSQNGRLRKSVLSRQTSIVYEFRENIIYLVYLFDNRKDPKKLK